MYRGVLAATWSLCTHHRLPHVSYALTIGWRSISYSPMAQSEPASHTCYQLILCGSWNTERPGARRAQPVQLVMPVEIEQAAGSESLPFEAQVVSNQSASFLKSCCPCNDWSCGVDGMNPKVMETDCCVRQLICRWLQVTDALTKLFNVRLPPHSRAILTLKLECPLRDTAAVRHYTE